MRIYLVHPSKLDRELILAHKSPRLLQVEINLDKRELCCRWQTREENLIPFEAFVETDKGVRPNFKAAAIANGGQRLELGGGYILDSESLRTWDEAQDQPLKP